MRTPQNKINERGEQAMTVMNEKGYLQVPDLMEAFNWSRPVTMTVLHHLLQEGKVVQGKKDGRNLMFRLPLHGPTKVIENNFEAKPQETVVAHVLPPVLNKNILKRIHLGEEFRVVGLFTENGSVQVKVEKSDGESLQLAASIG